MIQLRLYTYQKNVEIKTLFTFEPLSDRDAFSYVRQSDRAANLRQRRRPYARQEVREIKFAAGTLRNKDNFRNLQRLFDAHKIEWLKVVNGKDTWVSYDLDADDKLEYERLEEIDQLRRLTIKLVSTDPTWFTDFENASLEVHDL